MTAQRGKDILIKVGDGAGSEAFTTVAGMRNPSLKLNAQTVDISSADSTNEWRELLESAGIKSFSVSGSGVFKDAAVDEAVRALFFAGTIRNWVVVIPSFGTLKGKCQISGLEYGGNYDGEVTFTISLESAGEPTWTAA